ncbi:MAG: glycoside hydrolase family 13 protein [Chloroflexota bacterium]
MIYPEWLKSIHHNGSEAYLSNSCPEMGELVHVRLRANVDMPLQQIVLRTVPNGEQQFTTMVKTESLGHVQWWAADIQVNQPVVNYRFGLQAEEGIWWMNAAGLSINEPFDLFDFKLVANFQSIPWLRDAVFYQIFPDRFDNGNPSNDPQNENIGFGNYERNTYPWGEPTPAGQNSVLSFYGGDLQGIIKRLDHIKALGVNALYLNPVFKSFSSHRYDVIDYEAIDPVLGGNDALIELRHKLDENGMRYILDITPNHCGFGHPWFQKACADAESQEAGFFYFKQHPDDYESWMGHKMLPKFNYTSQELRRRMYGSQEGILCRWLQEPFAAHGWRVDVANMLGRMDADQLAEEIVPEIRKAVKATCPDAYLLAESFYESSSQLQGDGWDAVMNYKGFCTPLLYWLGGFHQSALCWEGKLSTSTPWPTEALVESWLDHLAAIPWPITLQQFNILDSHDTRRIRTILKGNDYLHRLAAVIQFTFPGVPCVYYGDEIGLMDQESFGSRNCMPWDADEWDEALLEFYKHLIAFRKESDILKDGGFQMLYWEEDFFIYQRELNQEHILVTANRSSELRSESVMPFRQAGIPDEKRFRSIFTEYEAVSSDGVLTLPKLSQGALIWVEE